MLLSKCARCDSKKSIFIKEQEPSGFLTGFFGLKLPLEGIPISGSS